jgi:hypothetical protein
MPRSYGRGAKPLLALASQRSSLCRRLRGREVPGRGIFALGLATVSYTILHISDLHRSPDDPLSNDELVSMLVADRDRYVREDPSIPVPDAIIVSGDLVYGVPMGTRRATALLADQYDAALDVLEQLTMRFLAGDRSRLILIPGNHDVDWNTARRAMRVAGADVVPEHLNGSSFDHRTLLRWSWRDRQAYMIHDLRRYEARLSAFDEMARRFYADATLPAPSSDDYRLFELMDGRVAVAAFNSCVGNDCFAFHGAIAEPAVALAHLDVRRTTAELRVAVWHHSIEGVPYATDYMDVATVYQLIGYGFRLGLHGHQHRADVSNRYVYLGGDQLMAVVSAGSLCAGGRDLPRGVNRQYNLIVLHDSLTRARVHVREVALANVFAAARRAEFGGNSFVDLEWPPLTSPEVARSQREEEVVLQAEEQLAAGNLDAAVEALGDVERPPGSYARTLMIAALREGRSWERLALEVSEPLNPEELVALVHSLGESGRIDEARTALVENAGAIDLGGQAGDLDAWIRAKEALNG